MKNVVVSALSAVIGAAAGAFATGKEAQKTVNKTQQMSDKHLALFLMMNRWVEVKQDGKKLADYFYRKGYKAIAVYGMSYAGERLLHELKGSNIEAKCGINRKADEIYVEVDMITPDDEIPQVDAVIVTSVYYRE